MCTIWGKPASPAAAQASSDSSCWDGSNLSKSVKITAWPGSVRSRATSSQISGLRSMREVRSFLYVTAESTMTSIFGRMATYSGKELKWDEAINSEVSIMPKNYAWDADPGPKMDPDTGLYPCPQPGVTKVV